MALYDKKTKWYGDKVFDLFLDSNVEAIEDANKVIEKNTKNITPVDTGKLKKSIESKVKEEEEEVIGTIGTKVDYGLFVEIGTRKKAAKPFLRPGLAKSSSRILKIIKDANK